MNRNDTELLTANGLSRRIKKHILAQDHYFFAVCTPGLEPVLITEIEQLSGVSEISADRGGVLFSGSIDLMIEASMVLRTANRILIRVDEFMAKSYPELFNRIGRIRWEPWIGFAESFDVQVSSRKSKLHHSDNMADSVSEACEKAVRSFGGSAVRSSENPAVTIMIRFDEDRCTVSLDCSGELLYRRGYRVETGFAPVRETIGAALLMLAGAESAETVIDPMSGSGTFCIEAELLAKHRAPNLERSFAFEQWPLAAECEGKFRFIRKKCAERAIPDRQIAIIGNDIEPKAHRCAVNNAERAHCSSVCFTTGDFRELRIPGERGRTVIACNPPYGKRVGEDREIAELYSDLDRWMKTNSSGASAAILIPAGREKLFPSIAVSQRISFSNGGIDVTALIGTVK